MHELKEVCRAYQPVVVFLMETRAPRGRVDRIRRTLKFKFTTVLSREVFQEGCVFYGIRKLMSRFVSHLQTSFILLLLIKEGILVLNALMFMGTQSSMIGVTSGGSWLA